MYLVEGNIGVGKSTFLSLMQQLIPSCDVILEPVDSWNHQNYGASLLDLFYRDPQRWAYTLETLSLKCRVRSHMLEQTNPYPYRLMERSVYSGHYVFASNDREAGYLTDLEWLMYSQWIEFLVHGHCTPPRGFIYLRATPEVCFERMKRRSRSSESTVPLEYLQQVHQKHEQFLINQEGIEPSLKAVPVLVLDCNEDFLANPDRSLQLQQAVEAFFEQTSNTSGSSADLCEENNKKSQKRV